MKFTSLFFILFLISTFISAQTPQMARDAQIIQKKISDLVQAWNDFDSKKCSLQFSEDADFTNSSGTRVFGRKAIEQLQEKYFSTCNKSLHLKITDKKIRYITNDITSTDVLWEMDGSDSTKTGRGLFACVMTRSDDDWLITVMHVMTLSANPQDGR